MTDADDLPRRLQDALGVNYDVERLLGSGGFASVFLVRDLTLKRPLAVKVLSPELVASRAVLQRFQREAETIAQLLHPHIVPLHFLGQHEELLYLAMAFVDGGSLADRVARERALPVGEVVRVMREVASALAHAHRRGVVHRDIKPANVLVDAESGRCQVTDFGIARTMDGGSLTATGMMLGTPAYMAPEQVTGEPSDHRVDLFALGVMAYELLAGQVPFSAATPTAALMRRLSGPPDPISSVRNDVPTELAAVLTTCMAVDPAERYQSGDDIGKALAAIDASLLRASASHAAHVGALAAQPTLLTPTTGRTRNAPAPAEGKWRRGLSLVGGAVLVVAGLWLALRRPAPPIAETVSGSAEMITIPGGVYAIGSDAEPDGLGYPRHQVTLAPFAIERTEVTIGAYREYVDSTKATPPWTAAQRDSSSLPVTHVSWGDAANYCAWRYRPDGRLPTEFEWEAAARGIAARDFPWGSTAEPGHANAGALRKGPVPVASFPSGQTPEGVQDLIGNVWEWTASPLTSYTGRRTPLPDSLATYRVIRGGAFDTPDARATPWARGYQRPTTPAAVLDRTGFRCARSTLAGRPLAP